MFWPGKSGKEFARKPKNQRTKNKKTGKPENRKTRKPENQQTRTSKPENQKTEKIGKPEYQMFWPRKSEKNNCLVRKQITGIPDYELGSQKSLEKNRKLEYQISHRQS